MDSIAETFMESLYFPDGTTSTPVVDSVDDKLFTSEIQQYIPEVINRMFNNDRDFAEAVAVPPGLDAMVKQTNLYYLHQFANYAEYGTFPVVRDNPELGAFLDFCRLCRKYYPDRPKIDAVNTSMEWLRYLESMWAVAFFNDIAGNIWDCSDEIAPPSVTVRGVMSCDYTWFLLIALRINGSMEQMLQFIAPSRVVSADDAAVCFNKKLLATPYHALGLRGGIWENPEEAQSC